MNPHQRFAQDHRVLREQAKTLQTLVQNNDSALSVQLQAFQEAVRLHFKREDMYYRILDDGKRVEDRELVHQLRNDHAATIFTLESLAIRLRKNGVNDDWTTRFDNLMKVFLPHLDQEEATLFPLGQRLLTVEELARIQKEIADLE